MVLSNSRSWSDCCKVTPRLFAATGLCQPAVLVPAHGVKKTVCGLLAHSTPTCFRHYIQNLLRAAAAAWAGEASFLLLFRRKAVILLQCNHPYNMGAAAVVVLLPLRMLPLPLRLSAAVGLR
jgi:hypothetical protein